MKRISPFTSPGSLTPQTTSFLRLLTVQPQGTIVFTLFVRAQLTPRQLVQRQPILCPTTRSPPPYQVALHPFATSNHLRALVHPKFLSQIQSLMVHETESLQPATNLPLFLPDGLPFGSPQRKMSPPVTVLLLVKGQQMKPQLQNQKHPVCVPTC